MAIVTTKGIECLCTFSLFICSITMNETNKSVALMNLIVAESCISVTFELKTRVVLLV